MNRYIGFSALAVALFFVPGNRLKAQESKGHKVYQQGIKSVVWVYNIGVGTGSGSLIDYKQRLIVTNYHVVTISETVRVMFPLYDANDKIITDRKIYEEKMQKGECFKGKVLFTEKKRDLAIVQLDDKPYPKGVVAIELLGEDPSPGDSVHSIGNAGDGGGLFGYCPGNCKTCFNDKFGRDVSIDNFAVEARMIETTSPSNHGDSGGPLMNSKGQQIGVCHRGQLHAVNTITLFISASEILGILKDHKVVLSKYRGPGTGTDEEEKKDGSLVKDLKDPKNQPSKDNEKAEKDAKTKLAIAKTFLDNGNKESARKYLNQVVASYANTSSAKEAKELLKELDK